MKQKTGMVLIMIGVLCMGTMLNAQAISNVTSEASKGTRISVRVKWDGKIIPGITNVSELRRTTEVFSHRIGGDVSLPRLSPGVTNYEPIVIERPRSDDRSFEQWANKVWNFGSGLGTEVSLKDFRKDIIIELVDPHRRVPTMNIIFIASPQICYICSAAIDTSLQAAAIENCDFYVVLRSFFRPLP